MKRYFILAPLFFFVSARAQVNPVSLVGENYLMLSGERFKSQKIIFDKAEGDWYRTEKDGHGSLEFSAPYDGRDVIIHIEWDGSNNPHLVNNEIRHNGKRTGEFTIGMSDKTTYGDGLNADPSEEDEIQISISKIDDVNVSGNITGIVTQGREKVKVNAAFNLKKITPSKKIVSSSYKNCDNVVHDKLIGAEGRSPSECEAKYDLDIRTVIHN